tara:strand:+ start:1116 stop:1532 length:417 start_codon:yes stop_codon:yes gene_type:complete
MFFKDNNNKEEELAKVVALLIHVAKIDQDFTTKESKIIQNTILEMGMGANKTNIEKIMQKGNEMEKNSNQILDFTKKVKNMNENNKIKIVESLWKIIYSDKEADIYEANLMRRLAGLLYIDSKIMGDIKEKIKTESLK